MAKILTISRQQLLDQLSPSERRKYENESVRNASKKSDDNILDMQYYHHDNPFVNNRNGIAIKTGTHGPEKKNGKIYISIYHYLEYLNIKPSDYNTKNLGAHLSSISGSDRISCKYISLDYDIHKYELEFLRKEEKNNSFKKYLNK